MRAPALIRLAGFIAGLSAPWLLAPWSVDMARAEPVIVDVRSGEVDDGFAASMAVGDFDGDGAPDLAVSAPDAIDPILGPVGKVHVWLGGDGVVGQPGGIADRVLPGEQALGFGATMAAADVDGDRLADLVVGDLEGNVTVYFGVEGAFADGGSQRMNVTPLPGLTQLVPVGDLDGDGTDDLAAVWPQAVEALCACADGGEGPVVLGGVAVLYGRNDRLALTDEPRLVPFPEPFADGCGCPVVGEDDAGACVRACGFGEGVIGGQPLDGNPDDALIVGAPGIGAGGKVYVYALGPDGASTVLEGPADGPRIGRSLAWVTTALDPQNPKLIVTADPGEVRVFPTVAGSLRLGALAGVDIGDIDVFEKVRFASGDFDGDGQPDLLVGDDGDGDFVGVLLGPVTLPPDGPDVVAAVPEGGPASIGWPFAVVGQLVPGFDAELAARVYDDDAQLTEVRIFVNGVAEPGAADGDGDGIPDDEDICPDEPDPTQQDRDGDGDGDACDDWPQDPADDADEDEVAALDCVEFYTVEVYRDFRDSPLRPLVDGDGFTWFEQEETEDAVPQPGLRWQGGVLSDASGLPPEDVRAIGERAWVTLDPPAGMRLSFDPYVHGTWPDHVGFALTGLCQGTLQLDVELPGERTITVRQRLDPAQIAQSPRFIGTKHPDGIRAVRVSADCDGALQIDAIEFGDVTAPFGCRIGDGSGDNCPDAWNPDQADTDGDGLGDACDCGADQAGLFGACAPRRAVRGFAERGLCGGDTGLDRSPNQAQWRAVLDQLGHAVEAAVETFDIDAVDRALIFVIDGQGPQGDAEPCAVDQFLLGGGAVLDVRDAGSAPFAVERLVPVGGEGDARTASCDAPDGPLAALCNDVEAVPFTAGALLTLPPLAGLEPFLVTDDGVIGAAVELQPDRGRLVVLGEGQWTWGKRVCGEIWAGAYEPEVQRMLTNVIGWLADGPGFDPALTGAAIEACFHPPFVGELPDLRLEAGEASDWIPLEVDDFATPPDDISVGLGALPDGVLDLVASGTRDGQAGREARFVAGPEAGEAQVRVVATDGDGLTADTWFTLTVTCTDPDLDELCNGFDPDDDGDGVLDGDDEAPEDPSRCFDTDGDGCDDCASLLGAPDTQQDGVDTDGDGLCDIGDPCPEAADRAPPCEDPCPDGDGDGVCDDDDPCPAAPDRQPPCEDPCPDGDGDGVCDEDDPCPEAADRQPPCENPCAAVGDMDEDAVCDPDDNCPDVSNDGQEDGDADGIGDACAALDDDMDGLTRAEEKAFDTLPDDPDSDGDGLTDGDEVHVHGTKPRVADSDDDGRWDGLEVDGCTDPLVVDPDADGDGKADCEDVCPLDPENIDSGDTDDDGVADCVDVCRFLPDPAQLDTDGDGVGDVCDLDDGHEQDDEGLHGLELRGGCRAAPGSTPTPSVWWLLGLIIALGRRGSEGRFGLAPSDRRRHSASKTTPETTEEPA